MMPHITTTIIALLLLIACGTPTVKPVAVGDPAEKANSLLANGEFLNATNEYLRLAETDKSKYELYRLRAANAFLEADASERAMEIVNASKPKEKEVLARYLKTLLLGKIQLYKNKPKQTLSLLSREPHEGIPDDMFAQTYLLRAKAYELLSQSLSAVTERLHYQHYIIAHDALNKNTEAIWAALNRIDTKRLKSLREKSPQQLSSWIDLALINQTLLSRPTVLKTSLSSWQKKFPAHPAIPLITDRLLQLSQRYALKPKQLALLLPLTGQFQKAAHAIRDGFLTAWYGSKEFRPIIKIYDTNSINIRQIYDKAVSEGADFIIGPLEKQAIINLAQSGSMPVTTLALNQADINVESNTNFLPSLIQFGLSPEDEARQVAERSFFDGHTKALVLTPDNDWGHRVSASFRKNWQATGGRTLESISFKTSGSDFASPVKQLLNVDSSARRFTKLRQTLNRKMINETRLRQDIDMIFLAAPPLYARQLIPQFKFYNAESIPIYSTSHIFSGNVNPEIDVDMEGVRFIDIPWMFSQMPTTAMQTQMNKNWQATQSPYRRLYALGIDAFKLIPHLSRLAFEPTASYSGETGILSMTKNAGIQRQLPWGIIQQGRPYLLDK